MSTTICRTRRPGGPPRAIRAARNPFGSLFATRRRQSQVAPPGARRDFGFDVGGLRRAGLATRSAIEDSWSGEGRFRTVSRFVFLGIIEATIILVSKTTGRRSALARRPYAPRFQSMLEPERTVSRAPVYQMLWLRGVRGHTISGAGFNLFKPLRRQFRATQVLSRRDPGDRDASVQKIDDHPRRSPPVLRRLAPIDVVRRSCRETKEK
jgi:hypothetical protein